MCPHLAGKQDPLRTLVLHFPEGPLSSCHHTEIKFQHKSFGEEDTNIQTKPRHLDDFLYLRLWDDLEGNAGYEQDYTTALSPKDG